MSCFLVTAGSNVVMLYEMRSCAADTVNSRVCFCWSSVSLPQFSVPEHDFAVFVLFIREIVAACQRSLSDTVLVTGLKKGGWGIMARVCERNAVAMWRNSPVIRVHENNCYLALLFELPLCVSNFWSQLYILRLDIVKTPKDNVYNSINSLSTLTFSSPL